MNLNLFRFKRVFLPLSFVALAVFASNLKASAEDPNSPNSLPAEGSATASIFRPANSSIPFQNAIAAIASRVTEPVPGRATTSANQLANGQLAQAINLSPLTVAQMNTVTAGIATPANSGAATLAPSGMLTTPDTVSPAAVPATGTTIAQNPAPSTPDQTTPGTTPETQTTPGTTPGTITPSTPLPDSTTPDTTTPDTTTPNTTPPGTTTPDTTAPGTLEQTTPSTTPTDRPTQAVPQTTPGTIEQSPTVVSPGRVTRSGSSYVGIGGNIGLGSGDTQLGQGSFAVLSKIGLLPSVSVRPSFLFSDDLTILLPITYDFSFGEGPTETLGFTAAPFVGIGAAISTGDGAEVGLLLTGGIDVPLSSQFTATASVNASVTGEAAVGILLGVGYNFQGF